MYVYLSLGDIDLDPMDQRTTIRASLKTEHHYLIWTLRVQHATYLVASSNNLVVLYALDLDVHREPKSPNLLRLPEVDPRMDYRVFYGVALPQATRHQL